VLAYQKFELPRAVWELKLLTFWMMHRLQTFELPRAVWELKLYSTATFELNIQFELPRAVWELKPVAMEAGKDGGKV